MDGHMVRVDGNRIPPLQPVGIPEEGHLVEFEHIGDNPVGTVPFLQGKPPVFHGPAPGSLQDHPVQHGVVTGNGQPGIIPDHLSVMQASLRQVQGDAGLQPDRLPLQVHGSFHPVNTLIHKG